MSFQYAFTRNVLIRAFKQGGAALTAPDFTLADRMVLLAPVAGFAVLAAAQAGISWVHDQVFNRQGAKERPEFVDVALKLDRAGVFGNLSPLVNAITSAKYERDASGAMVGAYMGAIFRAVGAITTGNFPAWMGGNNSPNTNNAERAAVRGAWSLIAAPAMVGTIAAALIPAWAKPIADAAAMYVGSSDMSRGVATAAFGEVTVRQRSPGGARGATSGAIQGGGGIRSSGGIRGGGGIPAR